MKFQIFQDEPGDIVQLVFAGSSSNYTSCFSIAEFEYLKKCVNDLENHYGEIQYCPNHAYINPNDSESGVLSLLSVDNGDYELQFNDDALWAQIQFSKKQFVDFKKELNNFTVEQSKETKQ